MELFAILDMENLIGYFRLVSSFFTIVLFDHVPM